MKVIYLIIGTLALFLGFIGVFLPILPTTPFLLLTAFCYAKGSKKFYNYFISTKIYKNYLEDFVVKKAMTFKKKVCLLLLTSVMILMACYIVNSWHARFFMILVMFFEYYYFIFKIKTVKEEKLKNDDW